MDEKTIRKLLPIMLTGGDAELIEKEMSKLSIDDYNQFVTIAFDGSEDNRKKRNEFTVCKNCGRLMFETCICSENDSHQEETEMVEETTESIKEKLYHLHEDTWHPIGTFGNPSDGETYLVTVLYPQGAIFARDFIGISKKIVGQDVYVCLEARYNKTLSQWEKFLLNYGMHPVGGIVLAWRAIPEPYVPEGENE